jgi:hypothetical protein
MNEKEQIEDLIKTKPKHYAKMVKNNAFLWNWVQTHSSTLDEGVPAQIYSAITGTSGACPNGSQYKLKSAIDGWVGCGKAATCKCVRDATSAAVSTAKSSYTTEEKAATNKKRAKTNLRKYGVKNVGQSTKAKENHALFYSDNEKVKQQVAKHEATMTEKYGVTNAAHLEFVVEQKKKTNVERYGVENPMQNKEIAKKSSETRMALWDPTELRKLNYRKFIKTCRERWGVEPLLAESEYVGVYPLPVITFRCLDCGGSETRKMDYGAVPICKICNPTEVKYESGEEVAVREFVKEIYTGPLRIRDRSIINPYELDIVLPALGIAIEYCGLYYHSEKACEDRGLPKKWNYHENKMKLAKAAGLRLITIFSDEWNTKQDIVKNKLRSIVSSAVPGVGARHCQVREVSRDEASRFHNANHIQGAPTRLKTNIGLFYDGLLVVVGSFNVSNGETTLSRYSSSIRVIGGCSKIIKFFLKRYPVDSIVSFADLRWSQGDMYSRMGFVEVSRVPPMQAYVPKGYATRCDKRAFPRHKINPSGADKTEWQTMQELGYDRIWDCGKIKYRLDVPKK